MLPPGAEIVDGHGRDRGLRFVDINEDGHDDIIFSNEDRYGLYLFNSMEKGWNQQVLASRRSASTGVGVGTGTPTYSPTLTLPMIARAGTNNGAWFHSRHLWVQNEETPLLNKTALVDRRSFNDMLMKVEPTAKSPEASLHCWQPRPGFEVELVAAEPLVQSPIAFAWGPDGKLWVVEMGDYPLGIDGKGKPGGRVKYLEDTNGDGKYDKATVFLDNLQLSRPASCRGARASSSRCARTSSTPRTPRATARPTSSWSFTPASSQGNPAAPRQRPGVGAGQLDLLRQRRQRRPGQVAQDRHGGRTSAAATSASGPTTGDDRAAKRARRSTAAAATTGATGSATTTATRCGTSCWTTTTCAAIRTSPPRPARAGLGDARAPLAVYPISRTLPRFNDPGARQSFHLGVQRHRLPRRPVRPGFRQQHLRQRAGP